MTKCTCTAEDLGGKHIPPCTATFDCGPSVDYQTGKPHCTMPESHEAHMALNGCCPWCGECDTDEISDERLRALVGEKEFESIKRNGG